MTAATSEQQPSPPAPPLEPLPAENSSELFLPLIVLMIFAGFRALFPIQYQALVAEGSAVETAQFILYFLSAFLCLGVVFHCLRTGRVFRAFIFVAVCPLLLFVCAEEIDWGQHFFGFENPDWMTFTNEEKGFALHNWDALSATFQWGYVVLGSALAFSSTVFSSWKNQKGWRGLYEILPNRSLLFYFFPTALFFLYLVLFFDPTAESTLFLFEDQELVELLFATGIFFHMRQVSALMRVKT
jgi:hypothetical protein